MLLVYVDESGDPGFTNSPTPAFILNAVIIPDDKWLATLDIMVTFRRWLRANFGLLARSEVKANELVRGKGPWKTAGPNNAGLAPAARIRIYERFMALQAKMPWLQTFSIVVNKSAITSQGTNNPRDRAWQFLIQRIERQANNAATTAMLFPDDGHHHFIEKKLRAMRRFNRPPSFFTPGTTLQRNALNIIEDPNSRRSSHSYFVQLADLNSYATFRHLYPHPAFPKDMWLKLGSAINTRVNHLRGGPPGIVSWP